MHPLLRNYKGEDESKLKGFQAVLIINTWVRIKKVTQEKRNLTLLEAFVLYVLSFGGRSQIGMAKNAPNNQAQLRHLLACIPI